MSDRVARGLRKRLAAMSTTPHTAKRRAGMSLIEVLVVVAIIGVFATMAAPGIQQFVANQRVKSAARSVADAFLLARAEAIRTGNAHIVFLSPGSPPATDPAGNGLGNDENGNPWPAIVLNDGAPGAWNCRIDGADPRQQIPAQAGVSWGYALSGGLAAPGDDSLLDPADGATFAYQGNPVTWVLFRGDGIPLTFDAGCNLGTIGSGGGAVYVTNGSRDYAVVLSPLGAVRVHAYETGAGEWTD